MNEHSGKLNEHTNKLTELENELDGNLKISSIDVNTLKLEDGKLSVIGGGSSTSDVTKQYVDDEINKVKDLIDDKANETHKHEISDVNGLQNELAEKVDKVDGKGLSTNDFTNEEKEKLASLVSHNHDTVYAKVDHTHDGLATKDELSTKADVNHDHNGIYAETGHKHDTEYASKADFETLQQEIIGARESTNPADSYSTLDARLEAMDIRIAAAGGGGADIDLSDYQLKTDLSLLTSVKIIVPAINEVNDNTKTNATNIGDLKSRVENLEDSDFITETELAAKGYLTEHQDLSNYATKAEIPTQTSQLTNDSTFITQTDLDGKGFLTSVPAEYVTETELSGKGYLIEQSLVDLGYAKKSDIPTNHVTQAQLTEVSNKVVALETSNTTLLGDVATLKTTVEGIDTTYATKEKLTEVSDKVTEVSGKVATLEASNTTLTNDVATLKTTVQGIGTTYATKTELTDGLSAKVNSTDLKTVATTGNYNDLENKPTIPTTVAQLTDSNTYALKTDIPNLATVATSGSYTDLINTPTLFSGSYDDLTEKPTIPSIDGLVKEQTLQDGLSLKADKTELEPIKTLLGEETLTTTAQTVTGGVNELKEKTEYVGKNTRKFNPKYCFSCFWGETTDTSGGSWTASIEKMTKDVNACKEANVDGFILIVHIGYNATTNNFYIVEDLDALQNGIDLMKENHIQPKAIKLHAQKYSSTDITTFGEDNFKTTWKNFITQIGEKFADCGFKYLTVHNEVKYIYNNNTYKDFVLECFELARNMGYKTGITNAGFDEACYGTISEILDNADAIFVNHYQPITNKGSKIQKQLSVDAWEYSFCMNHIDRLYYKYDKPIIISESGVQDYWCALAQPSKYSWSETQVTNGEAPYVYLYGAFEVLNSSPIAELWSWYGIDYPIVKNLIKYYMGGIYNE